MCPQSPNGQSDDDTPAAHEIVSAVLSEIGDVSRLMELVYLTRQPGLLETLRWFTSLREDYRRELQEFAISSGPDTILVERSDPSTLVIRRRRSE